LSDGVISTTQFLDLNERIGGYDQDANYVAARSEGDRGAMRRAQLGGLQLGGNGGLASIPVFDVSGIYNEDNAYHYQWFHFAQRERMRKANGDTRNHVMWRGNPVPADATWSTFIDWVAAYVADNGKGTQKQRVVRNKPANAVDGLSNEASWPPSIPCPTARGSFIAMHWRQTTSQRSSRAPVIVVADPRYQPRNRASSIYQ